MRQAWNSGKGHPRLEWWNETSSSRCVLSGKQIICLYSAWLVNDGEFVGYILARPQDRHPIQQRRVYGPAKMAMPPQLP